MQVDRVGNNVLSGESRPRVTLQWDITLHGVRDSKARMATTPFASNGVDSAEGLRH